MVSTRRCVALVPGRGTDPRPTTPDPRGGGAGRLPLALSREEVQHIARLARVGLSEDDIARFREQLSEILDHFDILRQIDTESVAPTSHTLDLQDVTGADEIRDSLPRQEILANAPI